MRSMSSKCWIMRSVKIHGRVFLAACLIQTVATIWIAKHGNGMSWDLEIEWDGLDTGTKLSDRLSRLELFP